MVFGLNDSMMTMERLCRLPCFGGLCVSQLSTWSEAYERWCCCAESNLFTELNERYECGSQVSPDFLQEYTGPQWLRRMKRVPGSLTSPIGFTAALKHAAWFQRCDMKMVNCGCPWAGPVRVLLTREHLCFRLHCQLPQPTRCLSPDVAISAPPGKMRALFVL